MSELLLLVACVLLVCILLGARIVIPWALITDARNRPPALVPAPISLDVEVRGPHGTQRITVAPDGTVRLEAP